MQQEVEANLRELEALEARTAQRFRNIEKEPGKRVLLLVNNPERVNECIQWIKSHGVPVKELILFISKSVPIPQIPQLVESSGLKVHHLAPLEMTTGTVAFLRNEKIDLVVIVGAHTLSKKEYEDLGFKPLLEEILLKEASQPVILFK